MKVRLQPFLSVLLAFAMAIPASALAGLEPGSPRALTAVVTVDAFGNQIARGASGTPTPNLYLYTGEQFDPDLGFYYLRARYSNPDSGRFWTMDSFEGSPSDPFSLHKYLYSYANPINHTDPSGHGEGDVNSLLATVNIIGQAATRYVLSIPGAARAAFATGGAALGAFFNQFGPMIQQFGNEVIEMLPEIESLTPVLEGFSRRPDWLLRIGNTLRVQNS